MGSSGCIVMVTPTAPNAGARREEAWERLFADVPGKARAVTLGAFLDAAPPGTWAISAGHHFVAFADGHVADSGAWFSRQPEPRARRPAANPRGRPLRAGRPKRHPARPDPTGGLSHAPDHRNHRLRHRRAVGRPALISPTSAVPGGVSASPPASKTCEFMTFATLVHHRQLHDYYYCIFCLLDLICNHIVTGFALYSDATCRVTPRHLPLISIRAKMFDIPSRHARWRALLQNPAIW